MCSCPERCAQAATMPVAGGIFYYSRETGLCFYMVDLPSMLIWCKHMEHQKASHMSGQVGMVYTNAPSGVINEGQLMCFVIGRLWCLTWSTVSQQPLPHCQALGQRSGIFWAALGMQRLERGWQTVGWTSCTPLTRSDPIILQLSRFFCQPLYTVASFVGLSCCSSPDWPSGARNTTNVITRIVMC